MRDLDDIESEERQLLLEQWGYPDFREWQKEILVEILDGEDVFCVAPTGGGKSLLFQLPALMEDGTTLVVSPLIALMKDQTTECELAGIPASFVNSEIEDPDEQRRRLEDFVCGAFRIFYIAPERMRVRMFREALAAASISRVVIDEAHCSSQWGHDFRPAYSRLFEIPQLLEQEHGKRPPILALTATATPDIEEDVAHQIGMTNGYVRFIADPVRPNLSYEVFKRESPWGIAEELAHDFDLRTGRYIMYASTRKMAEEIAEVFEKVTRSPDAIGFYHAGMRMEDRKETQDNFKAGRLRIIVATSAFGMGINVPNIRMVAHFGIPDSLESYTQQAGRAGRDGRPARCVLVHSSRAIDLQQFFLDMANPPYGLIESVWKHLQQSVDDAEDVLAETAASLATGVTAAGIHRVNDGHVTSALNILESVGAVKRWYAQASTAITLNKKGLAGVGESKAHGSVKKVAAALPLCLVNARTVLGQEVGYIDKATVGERAGVSQGVVHTVLKKLEQLGAVEVGETYTGKNTQVVKLGTPLHEMVSKEDVGFKRRRAQARLGVMIEYAELPSEKERKQLIREYFLDATKLAGVPIPPRSGPFN